MSNTSDPGGRNISFCERTEIGIFLQTDGVAERLRKVKDIFATSVTIGVGEVVFNNDANLVEFTHAVTARTNHVIAVDPYPNGQLVLARKVPVVATPERSGTPTETVGLAPIEAVFGMICLVFSVFETPLEQAS